MAISRPRLIQVAHMLPIMSTRMSVVVLCLIALSTATATGAQSYDASARELLRTMQQQPNDLARYSYLTKRMPELTPSDQMLARQFLSFSQNELGNYRQAVLNFPLKNRVPANLVLPTATKWNGVDAVDAITRLATGRRIVLVNEAHHNAQIRVLTLALLPRLRELGFTWFAAEALLDDDPDLTHRGYPIEASGSSHVDRAMAAAVADRHLALPVSSGDSLRTAIAAKPTPAARDEAPPASGSRQAGCKPPALALGRT